MTEVIPVLRDLIREHSWTPHQKVLTCAPDVEEALQAMAVKAMRPPLPADPEAVLASLMGINVIVAEDSPPGTWQLVRHDHCEVHLDTDEEGHVVGEPLVTHQDCTILGRSGD